MRGTKRAGALTVAMLWALATTAHAASFTVSNTNDSGAGSLRAAIQAANATPAADTIAVPAGTYTRTIGGAEGADPAATGDLDVTHDLTITGAGRGATVVDAAGLGRVFEVSGGAHVTLAALTVSGGASFADASPESCGLRDCDGGGIEVDGSALTLSDVAVTGNTARSAGGGIHADGASTLTINGSRIAGNTAQTYFGGGLAAFGTSTSTLTDSVVTGNHAPQDGGGGLSSFGTALTLTRTQVTANDAVAGGGISAGATLNQITDSLIADNTATSPGGGIHVEAGRELRLVGSTVARNTAASGGGLYRSGGTLTLTNSTITANAARFVPGDPTLGGYGGGVASFNGPLTATNVTFALNVADRTGPDVWNCGPADTLLNCPTSGTVTLTNTILADGCGGPITSGGHNLDAGNSCALAAAGDLTMTDPLLGPLADNGGPTPTQAPASTSPAIGAGDPAACPATDQRGVLRPSGSCDIGAYQGQAAIDTRITSGPSGPTAQATPTFAFVADPAAGATFACWIDAAAPSACTSPLTTAALADGAHVFHVQASSGGDSDATPATRAFFVDTAAPEASVFVGAEPGFGTAYAQGIAGVARIEVSATDPTPTSGVSAVRCAIDPAAVPASFAALPAGPCPTTYATVGVHTIYVAAADGAGTSSAVVSTSFTILGAPDTTITGGPDGPTNVVPVYTFTSSPVGAAFECALDGHAFEPCRPPHTIDPAPSEGQHVFRVRAIVDGVRDPVSASATFLYDVTTPTAGLDARPAAGTTTRDGTRFTGPVDVVVNSDDAEPGSGVLDVRCAVDPAVAPATYADLPAGACPRTLTGVGAHVVYAAAADRAGNRSPVVSRAFTILPAPETTITSGPTGASWLKTPAFGFTSSMPGSTFRCRLDGGGWTACATGFTAPELGSGDHLFEVAATSPEGAEDATPARRTFTINAPVTRTLHCQRNPLPVERDPNGDSATCTINDPGAKCPVGARCTYTVQAGWNDDDQAIWLVWATAGTPDSIYRYGGDGCYTNTVADGSHACRSRWTGTILGDGTTPFFLCGGIHTGAMGRHQLLADHDYNSDDVRRVSCDVTVRIEPATELSATGRPAGATVFAPGPGTLTVAPVGAGGRARAAGATAAATRSGLFRTVRKRVTKAGPVTIRLALTPKAKRALRQRKHLSVRLRTTFTPRGGAPRSRTTTITLTHPSRGPRLPG